MKKKILLFLLTLYLIFSKSSFAALESSSWTKESNYSDKVTHKLGFGFLNAVTGWTALLFEPAKPGNMFTGLAKGLGYTITNTAGGLIHAATFPIPVDVPLPGGGISHEYAS